MGNTLGIRQIDQESPEIDETRFIESVENMHFHDIPLDGRDSPMITASLRIVEPKIRFNVGGQSYSTTPSTLGREPQSILARMIEMDENRDRIRAGHELFIDRDGHAFGHVLNYLRNGENWAVPSDDNTRMLVLKEAEFYGLDGMAQLVKCAQNMKMAVSTLQRKPAAQVKILILGDGGVGKTSLLEQYCDNTFYGNQASTIGVDYRTKLCDVEGNVIKFYFWDTSGQERFRSVIRSYYRGSKGVIFVYDVTSRNSFVQLKKWMKDFDNCNGSSAEEKLPKVLLANKIDLADIRVVNTLEGQEFAEKHSMVYAEASAKTKEGVQNAFELVVQKILQHPELWDERGAKDAKRVKRGDSLKKFGLCC